MVASVTFDPNAGGDGSTITDDESLTTGIRNGGHRLRFIPGLAQFVAMMSWFAARTTANVTFAQMLAIASPVQGKRVYVTDVGVGGSSWVYSGTRWVPVGGRIIIAQDGRTFASPLASISGTAATTAFGITAPSIPANLLRVGSMLGVTALVRKNGANATWNCNVRLGTSNSNSDQAIAGNSAITNADNRQQWLVGEAYAASNTVLARTHGGTTGISPAASATASGSDTTANIDITAAMYARVTISGQSASDSFDLIGYSFWVQP